MAITIDEDIRVLEVIDESNGRLTKMTLRRCYCEGHCPNGQNNGTCEIRPGGMCFASVEAEYDEDGIEFPYRTYGCLPADERGLMQCKGHLVPHVERKSIQCCENADLCNRDLKPMYPERPTPDVPTFGQFGSTQYIVLFTSVTCSITVCLIVIAILYLRYHKKTAAYNKHYPEKFGTPHPHQPHSNLEILKPLAGLMIDKSSGSGSGMPILIQRTISKQIQMIKPIGQGRYGQVWLSKFRGESVAVKIFFTTEEDSWMRESDIYQTVMMRNENILGFIAADINGNGSWTQMILITDYHPNGSLYYYLQHNAIDTTNLLIMSKSIASGLAYLHTEICGTRGKPAIAHRDIKTKNILVKLDGECCIADFGLAIRYFSETNDLDDPRNVRSGTRRYMSPEILDGTINVKHFECHKMADMYAFGLVLWEMTRRCVISSAANDGTVHVEEYKVPYHDCVPSDPSFDDMVDVVCVKKMRPKMSVGWDCDPITRLLAKLMQECWHTNPAGRLTALRVKKTLLKFDGVKDGARIV